jgi:dTDP-4-dehydrorhamnose 3,5-epimerase-like enzyme
VTRNLPTGCSLIDLDVKGDERGSLIALEQLRNVPFSIQRVYFVYGTKAGVDRGFHAHRATRQCAVAVSGACTMILDNGEVRSSVRLDRPDVAVTIPPMVWHEMRDFSPDCVLLVLADGIYDEADYIRDYQQFLDGVRG